MCSLTKTHDLLNVIVRSLNRKLFNLVFYFNMSILCRFHAQNKIYNNKGFVLYYVYRFQKTF